LHYVEIDRYSRADSFLHRRDARIKLIAVLIVLLMIALSRHFTWQTGAGVAALLLSGVILSRLPLWALVLRAGVVLPFSTTLALISLFSGDAPRAAGLVARSYLSALTVVLLVTTTPMPKLFHAASTLGVPRVLVLVAQFLYRYLFVITEQALHMRDAALCRGAGLRKASRAEQFQAAGGALAVLFARSYEKAQGIERSMVARGFNGHIHLLEPENITILDITFLLLVSACAIAIRWWLA
jgi:cobalt/nickel transport system permease protein